MRALARDDRNHAPFVSVLDRIADLQYGRDRAEAELTAARATASDQSRRLDAALNLARTDPLTGLANRRGLDAEAPRELARAVRRNYSVCAVMLDVDRFKAFNDSHGHQAGDVLLKELAAAWLRQLRETDLLGRDALVARYGGEEFVVLLPDCDLRQAPAIVARLRGAMPRGQTCSAGVARWDRTESSPELLARADAALYEAKRSGRNQTTLAA